MADYARNLAAVYDMSTVDPPNLAPFTAGSYDGTGVGLVAATDIVEGVAGGRATRYNGTDEKTSMGDVGTIRAVALWVYLDTTTEEIFKTAAGRDVMANAGTITYAGLSAEATYVDGVAGVIVSADFWHHLVCIFDADEAADAFELATDGANFGALVIDSVRLYSAALTNLQATDLYARQRKGMLR